MMNGTTNNGGNKMNRTYQLQYWTNKKERTTVNETIGAAIEKARLISAQNNTDVRVYSNFGYLVGAASCGEVVDL